MTKSELHYETTRKELLAVIFGLKQFRQYLLGRHFVIRTDHAALSWLRKTPEPMPQLARWLTLIEQYDYEVIHRHGKQHANADGLSRRPTIPPIADDQQVQQPAQVRAKSKIPTAQDSRRNQTIHAAIKSGLPTEAREAASSVNTDETSTTVNRSCQQFQSDVAKQPTIPSATDDRRSSVPTNILRPKVRIVKTEPEVVHLLVKENLADDQRADAELGRIIQLRLETYDRPTNESIQTDSELTKKMVVKWDSLEVHNGLVYRRFDSSKPSTPTMLQLLVPRCCVPEVLRLCHTGTVGGHFGVKKTMDQVQRRFYWAT